MRFGVREFIQHFLSLFSHFPGKEDLVFRADFLCALCENSACSAVKGFEKILTAEVAEKKRRGR
jgi:hypothetical protein